MNWFALNHVQSCLGGIALAVLSASVASAEIFPPVTIKGVYQQTTTTTSNFPPNPNGCTGFATCNFLFDRVPSDKQLIITSVSCGVNALSAPGMQGASLRLLRPNGLLADRKQALRASKNEGDSFVINDPALMPVDSRWRPIVTVTALQATNIIGYCSIAGQISNAPP